MGYRAGFWKETGEFINELPKFYGYLDNCILQKLDSIKWLLKHDKLKEEMDFGFGDISSVFADFSHPEINFSPEEFREFINLYNKDFIKYRYTIWQPHFNRLSEEYPYKDGDILYSNDFIGFDLLEKLTWLKELYNNDENKIMRWG